jgi:hypothetical protein
MAWLPSNAKGLVISKINIAGVINPDCCIRFANLVINALSCSDKVG